MLGRSPLNIFALSRFTFSNADLDSTTQGTILVGDCNVVGTDMFALAEAFLLTNMSTFFHNR